jgi:hypothetical protein
MAKKKEIKGQTYKENDPILDKIYDAIEDRLGDNYAQNYECNIEFTGDEEDENEVPIIDGVDVKVEHNVDWTDREERHPWVEIEVHVDFVEKTIELTGNISSKDGRIDEDVKDSSSFDDIDEIADTIADMVQEAEYELDNAS